VNSEELEQSLHTEFENYLKDNVSDLKQEVSSFKDKIEAAFEKHKSEIDGAFQEFFDKFGEEKELEESFRESVSEHLKLARDEGSKITAAAFAEAEKLTEDEESADSAAAAFQFADMRDAINEISAQDSQSEILKSLVEHAAQFTPRGAFFIVKNEHLVGWRMFGTEEHDNPQVVREVFFPISSKTALSESVETLATVEGSSMDGEDDLLYLNKLGFEQSEKMYAIPLVARGRGVAVLYADKGSEDGNVNVEALETLMRVAGLTVEVLASTQMAKTQVSEKPAYAGVQVQTEAEPDEEQYADDFSPTDFEDTEEPAAEFEQTDFATADEAEEAESASGFDFQPAAAEETEEAPAEEEYSFAGETEEAVSDETEEQYSYEDDSWTPASEEPAQDFSSVEDDEEMDYSASYNSFETDTEEVEEPVSAGEDYQAGMDKNYEQPYGFESNQFDNFADTSAISEETDEAVSVTEDDSNEAPEPSYTFETSGEDNFADVETETADDEAEPAFAVEETVAAPPVRSRFADRNVDLPIEVAEDERRLHNDARRFARLLVSEIKLYNEQKVKEGRESSDLYERLREAIDRSREMYDKRVQPPVAAKFDYFNYELINTLAEGDEGKLGTSYPGATV
jgi:hypothetical protein